VRRASSDALNEVVDGLSGPEHLNRDSLRRLAAASRTRRTDTRIHNVAVVVAKRQPHGPIVVCLP
jgi:hypothetical protein